VIDHEPHVWSNAAPALHGIAKVIYGRASASRPPPPMDSAQCSKARRSRARGAGNNTVVMPSSEARVPNVYFSKTLVALDWRAKCDYDNHQHSSDEICCWGISWPAGWQMILGRFLGI